MLRVLTKTATYVENMWYGVGQEIVIAEHHFSDEVHILLEDLGLKEKPAVSPPAEPTPVAAIPSTEFRPAAPFKEKP